MTKSSPLLLIVMLLSGYIQSQPSWSAMPAPVLNDRYDDLYFINADTGWAIYETGPWVLRTTDGGNSWQKTDSVQCEFRDVGFLDANTGFIGLLHLGSIAPDTTLTSILRTQDGGLSWSPMHIPRPSEYWGGVCGMRVINDSTLYAVGAYWGEAGFYKTTDRGNTWTYTDMSAYAGGLVDIFFFNADTGFVCGTNGIARQNNGVILYTTDAGNTWTVKKTSEHLQELCWKLSFPSRNVGYASLEAFRTTPVDSQFCLKTTDGGLTWNDVFVANEPEGAGVDMEGIGFLNDSVGWVGGRNGATGLNPVYTYKTTNGGLTWAPDYWGKNVNRFRFISDTLAYCAGQTLYKFSNSTSGVDVKTVDGPPELVVYPNPAHAYVLIKSERAEEVSIFNISGQLISETRYPDANRIDVETLPAGTYIAKVKIRDKVWNIKWQKL